MLCGITSSHPTEDGAARDPERAAQALRRHRTAPTRSVAAPTASALRRSISPGRSGMQATSTSAGIGALGLSARVRPRGYG